MAHTVQTAVIILTQIRVHKFRRRSGRRFASLTPYLAKPSNNKHTRTHISKPFAKFLSVATLVGFHCRFCMSLASLPSTDIKNCFWKTHPKHSCVLLSIKRQTVRDSLVFFSSIYPALTFVQTLRNPNGQLNNVIKKGKEVY